MTTVVTLSNRLEPSARAFLETVNSSGDPPIYQLPVSDTRGILSGAQSGPVEKMDARIEDHVIKGGPMARSPFASCAHPAAPESCPSSCTSTVEAGCWATKKLTIA
jgi:hypothetical protein